MEAKTVPFEFFASCSGLAPRKSFTLDQHQQKAFLKNPQFKSQGVLAAAQSLGLTAPQAALVVDQLDSAYPTNELLNPSFEAASGTAEFGRNYVNNPVPTAITNYTKGGTVSATVTYETTLGPSLDNQAWIKMVTSSAGQDLLLNYTGGIVTGTARYFDGYVYSSVARTIRINMWTYDGANAYLGGGNDINLYVAVQPGWNRITAPLTQPGTAYAGFRPMMRPSDGASNPVASGETYGVALTTISNNKLTYFDGTRRPQLRINMARNPRQVSGGSSAEDSGRYSWSGSSITGIVNHPEGITTAKRHTAPASPSQGPGRGVEFGGNFDVAPGTTSNAIAYPVRAGVPMTASVWVRNSDTTRIRFRTKQHNGAGTWLPTTTVDGPYTTMSTTEWTRLSVSYTPTTNGYVFFRIELERATHVAGDWFEYTGILIEESSTVNKYFDGSERPRIRKNHLVNPVGPRISSDAGWTIRERWAGNGSTQVLSDVSNATDGPPGTGITSYLRKTWTVVHPTLASMDVAWAFMSSRRPVVPGQKISVGYWWRPSFGTVVGGGSQYSRIRATFYTAATGGTNLGSVDGSTDFEFPDAGEWQYVYGTITVPNNGATHMELFHFYQPYQSLPPVGGTLDATGAIVEYADATGTFFKGDTSPTETNGFAWESTANASASIMFERAYNTAWQVGANGSWSYTYDPDHATAAWSGTAHNSQAVLSAPAIANVTVGNGYAVNSTSWSKNGAESLRMVPILNSTETYVIIAGSESSLTGNGVTLVPGKTYTVLVTCRLTAAQTASPNAAARGIRTQANSVGGWTGATYSFSANAANTAGTTAIKHVFTVPANAVWCSIRLYNGATVMNGDVWFDSAALIEGDYSGAYFDGDTDGAVWLGAAHASKAIKTSF